MRKVLLSSGGMDSYLLAHSPELIGAEHVFVNVGQAYGLKERHAAEFVARSVGTELREMQASDLARFEHKPTGIIPFRNAELILCAAQFGEAIYLGVIADEVNSDKSPEFMRAMEQVLNISHRGQYWTSGRTFELRTPFCDTTKTELIRNYLDRGGELHALLKTVSCYDGGDRHCGKCSSCFKRWVALTCALGQDADEVQPWVRHPGRQHPRSYWVNKLAGYPERRTADVFRALEIAGVQ